MSAAGKKSKKNKVLSLGEFLGNGPELVASSNWAEEMDKHDPIVVDRSQLPTAPKSILQSIDLTKVPTKAPFKAHVSNISYMVEEDRLRGFFKDLKIVDLHMPLNERQTGHKGIAFIEFEDRNSLIEALSKNEQQFEKRPLKIVLEDHAADQNRQNQHHTDSASEESNWRRGPPQSTDEFDANDTANTSNYDEHNDSGNTSYNSYNNQRYNNNNRFNNNNRYNNQNNRNNYNNRHKQYDNSNNNQQYDNPDGNQQQYRRRNQQNRQYYNNNNNHNEKRQNYHQYQQTQHRTSTSDHTDEPLSPQADQVPQERPKLNLQPRTKPIESETINEMANASIFGGAKPVDTAKRERDIEEKLIKEREELKKKEAEKQESNNEGPASETTTTEQGEETTDEPAGLTTQQSNDDTQSQHSQSQQQFHHHQRRSHPPSGRQHNRNDQQLYSARSKHQQRQPGNNAPQRSSTFSSSYSNNQRRSGGNDNMHQQDRPNRPNPHAHAHPHPHPHSHGDYTALPAAPPAENVWKRPTNAASELFNQQSKNEEQNVSSSSSPPPPPPNTSVPPSQSYQQQSSLQSQPQGQYQRGDGGERSNQPRDLQRQQRYKDAANRGGSGKPRFNDKNKKPGAFKKYDRNDRHGDFQRTGGRNERSERSNNYQQQQQQQQQQQRQQPQNDDEYERSYINSNKFSLLGEDDGDFNNDDDDEVDEE